MEERDEDGNPLPAVADAVQVPRDFVRQISRPDDKQLPEREVSPHHREGEQQVSKLVKVFLTRERTKSR